MTRLTPSAACASAATRESPAQLAAHRAQAAAHRTDLSAWEQASRDEGIASGRLIPLQSGQLQFADANERKAFAEHCPLGCPHASPVLLGTGLLRRCHKDGPPHVCIMLRVRRAVHVGGAIVGYGKSHLPVRRVDTCTCPACDEARRGIREAWRMCRFRGDPFGPLGRDYDRCPRFGVELRTPTDVMQHRSGDVCMG